ncbi:hypothetical protein Tco_0834003 [Tanacetum coccineum]
MLRRWKVYFAPDEVCAPLVTCGTISKTGNGAEINIVRLQVHDRGSGDVAMDEGQGADKGVSVKEYLVKTLRPEDEDKALSPYNYSSIVMNRIYPKRPSRRFHIHQEGSKEPIGGVVDQRDQFTGRLEDPRLHLKIQEFTSTNWRHQWDLNSIYQSSRMTGCFSKLLMDPREGSLSVFWREASMNVEEMMVRLDDFVRSEEAFSRTELPKGEAFKHSRRKFLSAIRRDDRPHRNHYGGGARRNEKRNNHRRRDNYDLYRGRDNRAPYPPPRGDYQGRVHLVFTLDALTKPPKEILVTKTQLRLPPLRPMLNPSKGGNVIDTVIITRRKAIAQTIASS